LIFIGSATLAVRISALSFSVSFLFFFSKAERRKLRAAKLKSGLT
jgi:hypothetical protein